MAHRFLCACCFLVLGTNAAFAQTETTIYKGLRISLFDVKMLQQNKNSIKLLCQGANTGRLPIVTTGKNAAASAALLVELDTFSMPSILQGREYLITEALRKQKLEIEPGAIQENIRLSIPLKQQHPVPVQESQADGKLCTDLVFDTAYVAEYTDKSMMLHFAIKNIGTTSANLLGPSAKSVEDNVAVNVYFISGDKFSRGAIYADGLFIREGVETIDGILQPGQVLEGALEISLKNRTRFSPNLVFELDPFQRVDECDRTNNTRVVIVAF